MAGEPLVAAEIRDQFGASSRKRQARMEMSLMDRERRVDGSAAAMNDGRPRECKMDQPGPEEVERHLVGDSLRFRRDRAQHAKIVRRRFGQKCLLIPCSARTVPRRSALVPEIQLAAALNM